MKYLKISTTMLLIALAFLCENTRAQNEVKNLAIGDICPDVEFSETINFNSEIKRLSDFKDKAIILDFWATWCGTCIAKFPSMYAMQDKFRDRLQFLPVTYQDRETVSKMLNTVLKVKGIKIPTVINDSTLTKFFKHNYLPHYVWLDRNRKVIAITGADDITEGNIQKFLEKNDLGEIKVKKDIRVAFDNKQPMLEAKVNNILPRPLYRSMIGGYSQYHPGGSFRGDYWIDLPNHSMVKLFQLAYGKFDLSFLANNKIYLEGNFTRDDSLKIGMTSRTLPYKEWWNTREQNAYTYELVVPESSFTKDQMFAIMQQDINNFFRTLGYQARFEKRKGVKGLALVRTSSIDKISSSGGSPRDNRSNYSIDMINLPMSRFVQKFQVYYSTHESLPIIDKTEYSGKIDIQIMADLKDINQVNRELERYDLKFVEGDQEMDMIVITKLK